MAKSRYGRLIVLNEFTEFVRGYDIDGNEKLWIVTNGNVNSLTLIDANNDGKNEIVCGCDNGTIQIYRDDTLLMEFMENSAVVQMTKIGMCAMEV